MIPRVILMSEFPASGGHRNRSYLRNAAYYLVQLVGDVANMKQNSILLLALYILINSIF